jgi:hypothetical protein
VRQIEASLHPDNTWRDSRCTLEVVINVEEALYDGVECLRCKWVG